MQAHGNGLKARVLCSGVVVLALALAGCGGGGGSSSAPAGGDNVAGGPGGSSGGSTPPPPPPAPPPPPPTPNPTNRAPVANPTFKPVVFIKVGFPIDLDVTQGGMAFSDPDGDPLKYAVVFESHESESHWNGLVLSGTRIRGTPPNYWGTYVRLTVSDGKGGELKTEFILQARTNTAPVVARAQPDRVLDKGAPVDLDATALGTVFTDPDDDVLSYRVSLLPRPLGLQVEGTRVWGVLAGFGAVFVEVEADDGYGGVAKDVFAIAAPAPESRRPTLPAEPYVYADEQLALPLVARQSRIDFFPLWDTTHGAALPVTNAGATLGRVLFYDRRLSIHNLGSCGSCHLQQHGFASPERFTEGPQGDLSKRNVMGLTGVRYNVDNLYFGDGRARGLEQLVLVPIEDRTELGNSMKLLPSKLSNVDFYPPLFAAAFGTPDVTEERIALALGQFMRSMIAFNTRFDRAYHPLSEGERPQPEAVFTAQELRGAEIFNGSGNCARCHAQGAQTMDIPANNGLDLVLADPGSGSGRFRTASLRNVAATAPYMHDGRFQTLREVINHYSEGAVDGPLVDPRMRGMLMSNPVTANLSEPDKDALEAFLNTFTDTTFLEDPRFADPFPPP